MEKSLDKSFRNIQNQKWLPFIGDNYLKAQDDKKLLIVGESHYHDNSKQSIDKHNAPSYTRLVIEELAIDRLYYDTKIFPNFHRAMFGNDNFDSNTFWNLTSFYNFIQRPMETNIGRPSYYDFYDGWATFFEIIKISKPKTCLFIGVGASNSLHNAIAESDFELVSFKEDDKISRTYPRQAIIKNSDNQHIDLIFIQHTSHHFSWSKWNEYINDKLSNQIKWFTDKMQ